MSIFARLSIRSASAGAAALALSLAVPMVALPGLAQSQQMPQVAQAESLPPIPQRKPFFGGAIARSIIVPRPNIGAVPPELAARAGLPAGRSALMPVPEPAAPPQPRPAIIQPSLAPEPGDMPFAASGAVVVQGLNRLYIAHRPDSLASAPAGQKHPVMIVLHSGGGSAERIADLSQFNRLADLLGFMAVYPHGIDRFWNDGRIGSPGAGPIDDVAFIARLAGHLVDTANADPARIYLVGYVDGGMLAQRLACEQARLFAAVATVNATLPEPVAQACQPGAPTPIMMINGTSDPFVPFEGGESLHLGRPSGNILGAKDTIDAWRRSNGCLGDVDIKRLRDLDRSDGSTVVRQAWDGCRGGSEVVLYEIERGGHTWPGTGRQLAQLRRFLLGRPNMDLEASIEIWEFLERFRRIGSPLEDPLRNTGG